MSLGARWVLCVFILSSSFCYVASVQAAKGQKYEFNIPGQGIESALSQLAEQTSTMLLFPYETVQLEESKPVVGNCTLYEALSTMLRGTGLNGDLTKGGVITISQNNNKSVNNKVKLKSSKKFSKNGIAGAQTSNCGAEQVAVIQNVLTQELELDLDLDIELEQEDVLEEILVTTGSFLTTKPYNEVGALIDALNRSDLDDDAPTGRLVEFLRFLPGNSGTVSYTHLRAHETPEHLVCRLLLEKKK